MKFLSTSMLSVFLTGLLSIICLTASTQVEVYSTATDEELVESFLLGSGVLISNLEVTGSLVGMVDSFTQKGREIVSQIKVVDEILRVEILDAIV